MLYEKNQQGLNFQYHKWKRMKMTCRVCFYGNEKGYSVIFLEAYIAKFLSRLSFYSKGEIKGVSIRNIH